MTWATVHTIFLGYIVWRHLTMNSLLIHYSTHIGWMSAIWSTQSKLKTRNVVKKKRCSTRVRGGCFLGYFSERVLWFDHKLPSYPPILWLPFIPTSHQTEPIWSSSHMNLSIFSPVTSSLLPVLPVSASPVSSSLTCLNVTCCSLCWSLLYPVVSVLKILVGFSSSLCYDL